MKRKLRILIMFVSGGIAAYLLYAVVWSLFTPRPSINIQLAKAVATSNKKKMTIVNQFWRFDSAALTGNKTVQFHFTITKWVKGADTSALNKVLTKNAYTTIKTDEGLQEFRDSNVVFIYQYLDSINQYTYNIPVTPADYK